MEYIDDAVDGIERLRIAIVAQVVEELKRAMLVSDREGEKCQQQKDLERWLLSPWGQTLSGNNGEKIIRLCQRTYNVNRYRNGKAKIPDKVKEQIRNDWKSGMKRSAIRRKYGVSAHWLDQTIVRWKKDEIR